jgi:ankyrin repeat protein
MLIMFCRFRWAACQLDTLAQCVTLGKVRRALQDLPQTLDATYERILRTIDEGQHAEEALKILTWLTYAERPLTAPELLHVTGIMVGEESRFDEEEVLRDQNDIVSICSSLVSFTTDGTGNNGLGNDDARENQVFVPKTFFDTVYRVTYVRLAHFSVKEYLVSSRPRIERYRLQVQEAHDILARYCLVYLLRFEKEEWRSFNCESVFSLARYAARYWTQHARASGIPSKQQQDLSMELFTQNTTAYIAWMRFFDINQPWNRAPYIGRMIVELPNPLYVASYEGLEHTVKSILHTGADVNAQGGEYGNALQAALYRGHVKVVQILVDAGAEVNVQGGEYGSALQATSFRGHEKVAQVLVNAGADVNAQGGEYSSALQAASFQGHEKVAQVLVNAGADVNAQGGRYGSALQAASQRGHVKVVQLLVDAGADVDAQGGEYGSALQAASASFQGHEKVAQILLAAGADVDAQGGEYGSALQAASFQGHEKVAQVLVNAGADVNAQGGRYSSALQAASRRGHVKVVQLLVDAGADVNAQGGQYGSALQAAALGGHEQVAQMLAVDTEAIVRLFGTPLEAASLRGRKKVVRMLVDAGAQIGNTEWRVLT